MSDLTLPPTPRQLEILALAARGLTNHEIATLLGSSDKTVQTHLSTTFARLGVRNRADAVGTAIRRGLIQ